MVKYILRPEGIDEKDAVCSQFGRTNSDDVVVNLLGFDELKGGHQFACEFCSAGGGGIREM